jgi:SHS2 domain-containing protein
MVRESNSRKVELDMVKVQTDIANIKENQEMNNRINGEDHKAIVVSIKENTAKLQDFIDASYAQRLCDANISEKKRQADIVSNDTKYASKKIETIFWWGLSIVGGLIITALMYTIIK